MASEWQAEAKSFGIKYVGRKKFEVMNDVKDAKALQAAKAVEVEVEVEVEAPKGPSRPGVPGWEEHVSYHYNLRWIKGDHCYYPCAWRRGPALVCARCRIVVEAATSRMHGKLSPRCDECEAEIMKIR
jgi:hypothetical protein